MQAAHKHLLVSCWQPAGQLIGQLAYSSSIVHDAMDLMAMRSRPALQFKELQNNWPVQLTSGDRQYCSLSPAKIATSNGQCMSIWMAMSHFVLRAQGRPMAVQKPGSACILCFAKSDGTYKWPLSMIQQQSAAVVATCQLDENGIFLQNAHAL